MKEKGRGSVGKRGVKPLSINIFPLSFEGEGDKRGEVSKHSTLTVNSSLQKLSFSSLHSSLFLRLLVVIVQKVKYSMDNQ